MKYNSNRILEVLSPIMTIIIMIGIFAIMSFINPLFTSLENIITILINISIEGIIAIGMTYLIIVREIDLSVGGIMGLSCVFTIFFQKYGIIPGILAGIIAGLIVGIINGFIVTQFKLPSMGVTLATQAILNGLILVLTNQQTIRGIIPNFYKIAEYPIFGIEIIVIIYFISVVIFEFILQKTIFGRNILACGGNVDACIYASINVKLIKMLAFIITGFLSGIAGVLMVAKYNSAGAVIGTNTAFYIITAVLLGGISLAGGEGSVLKSFQGMLFIGVLDSLLYFMNWGTGYRNILIGTILIIGVVIDSIVTKRKQYL